MADLSKLVDELSELSVLDAAQLTRMLEEKWGVSAAAPVAMAPPGMGAAATATAPAEEEKTEFDVILKDVGLNKIEVIKAIRQLTSLGLREAKEMAETAGAKVLEGANKEAAQDAKAKLEAAGAAVQVA